MPFVSRSGLVLARLLTVALASSAAEAAPPQQCTAQWDQMVRSRQTGPLTYQGFMRSCLAGNAPANLPIIDAPDGAPAGATARCRDGTYTSTTVLLAACLHHGGVAAALRP